MGTPSDWVSGERVFAPPTGTFDVDWLVPAVLEAVPGTAPAEARVALLQAWADGQVTAEGPTGAGPTGAGPTEIGPTGAGPTEIGPTEIGPDDPLRRAAARVVDEARRTFRT